MKTLTNIELFNGITGKTFAILYGNFPVETEINPSVFLKDFIDPNDFDGAWNLPEFAEATLEWLNKAGYIWLIEPKAIGDNYTATLSPKGLEVLKHIPESLESKTSIGEKIIEKSKGKINDVLNQLVSIAISEGVKLILR
jgi:hypothetical protein